MKRAQLFVVALVSAILLVFSVSVRAQDPPAPTLPDFSQWDKVVLHAAMAIDGKNLSLMLDRYENMDIANMKRYVVSILYNEQNQVWIATYFDEEGEAVPGNIITKEIRPHLFESREGKWALVKSFSPGKDLNKIGREILDFLEVQYKITIP